MYCGYGVEEPLPVPRCSEATSKPQWDRNKPSISKALLQHVNNPKLVPTQKTDIPPL